MTALRNRDNYFKVAVFRADPITLKPTISSQAFFPFCSACEADTARALHEATEFRSRMLSTGDRCCRLSVYRCNHTGEEQVVPEVGIDAE